ncbi:hypothetical protein FE257_003746 [Aspergillus nanangensis]|uniref:Zn(2)-C6 fungal-type domain-containing protein n=1 Tax=Aspergillus nanangensis TaxID=2582783 RepID=A0AAD4CBR3_ASPNN|nr:hypothetical protein FE257_003746 [Aspergillus nanangensis]
MYLAHRSPTKKRKRATQACLNCRSRKVRCDVTETENICTNCRLDGLKCTTRARKQTRPTWNDGLATFRSRHLSNESSEGSRHNRNGTREDRPERHNANVTPTTEVIELDDNEESVFCPGTPRGIQWTEEQEPGNTPGRQQNGGIAKESPNRPHKNDDDQEVVQPHTPSFSLAETAVDIPRLPPYIKPLPDRLNDDDLNYLRRKEALTIPDDHLRDRLLQGFIDYVYGYMPILDLKELLQAVQTDGQNAGPRVSLLLFQAILFSGSAFVDMEHLRKVGYRTRRAARKTLFERVKVLYQLDVEQSSMAVIQAILLMTYWFHDPHGHKDLWCWMGTATTLSRMIALHETPDPDAFSRPERRMRKRLAWCVFMRDQVLALGMRRPPHIRLHEHKIPRLTLEDFECGPLPPSTIVPDCAVVRDPLQRRQLAVLCIEKCKLCVCIDRVLACQFRTTATVLSGDEEPVLMLVPELDPTIDSQRDACTRQLESWSRQLPIMCMYDSVSALSACETTVMVIHKALLKMIYLTLVATLYRPHILPYSPWSSGNSSIVKGSQSLSPIARMKIQFAASEISTITHDLRTLHLVHYLPTSSVTVLLPALMVNLIHIAHAQEEVAMRSMQQFSSGMEVLTALSDNYASAEVAMHFLESTMMPSIPKGDSDLLLQPSPASQQFAWPKQMLGEARDGGSTTPDSGSPADQAATYPEWSVWLNAEPSNPGSMDGGLADGADCHRCLPGDDGSSSGLAPPDMLALDPHATWSGLSRSVLGWETGHSMDGMIGDCLKDNQPLYQCPEEGCVESGADFISLLQSPPAML